MAPPRRITPATLEAAPRKHLSGKERRYADHLLDLARKRPWTEPELRQAAAMEVKAWAIEDGTWIFEPTKITARQFMQRHTRDLFRK